jgi:single-strand DNA-binding protein
MDGMADLRMPDLNMVVVAGRLTRDPELKYTGTGRAYCKVSVANTRRYKTKDGEQREESVFLDGTLWDKFAEYVGDKFRKGRPVLIEGRLRQNEWEDRETGQKRSKIELQINRLTPLDWDEAGGSGGGGGGGNYSQQRAAAPSGGGGGGAAAPRAPRHIEEPLPEDDIPF